MRPTGAGSRGSGSMSRSAVARDVMEILRASPQPLSIPEIYARIADRWAKSSRATRPDKAWAKSSITNKVIELTDDGQIVREGASSATRYRVAAAGGRR